MMNEVSAKTDILAAIKTNLSASRSFEPTHAEYASDPTEKAEKVAVGSNGRQTQQALADIFRDNLTAVGGKFTTVGGSENLAVALQSILDELGARTIAISDSDTVGLAVRMVSTKAQILVQATAEELFGSDVGITEAQWAIAETGTLVLEGDKEASRLTSLVPGTHICILHVANIRPTMSAILQILESSLSPVVTFITGPSRTSDIELTLALGIHGPRSVYVIVVDDA